MRQLNAARAPPAGRLDARSRFVEAIRRSDGVSVVRAQLEDQPELEREFERLLLILGRR